MRLLSAGVLATALAAGPGGAAAFLAPGDMDKLTGALSQAVEAFGQIAGNDGDWKGQLQGQWGWLKDALSKHGVEMPGIPADPGATTGGGGDNTGGGNTGDMSGGNTNTGGDNTGGDNTATNTGGATSGGALVTASEIACLFGCNAATASQYEANVNSALREAGATTAKRIQMFAAQIGHESIGLTQMREIGSASYCRQYEGRSNLGNTQPGDGCRFKGRGPIQLTGRYNYDVCGKAIGMDLVANPDVVASDPAVGFKTTVWFWTSKRLNGFADSGDLTGATRRINGGSNGASDRANRYNRAKTCISDATIQQRASAPSTDASSTNTNSGADTSSSNTNSGNTNTNTNTNAGSASCDMSSLSPSACGDAYASGRNLGARQCIQVQGKPVATDTYCPLMRLVEAMRAAGVNFQLNSAFRTQADQTRLYNCYRNRNCNNGNLAARPGYSRHQNGIAFDISQGGNTYTWLRNNARQYGFVRTVRSENWHWEYRPGSRCNQFVSYTCQ
eukprot:TRINITY_DN6379_c0_g8_i1.p1 TRINITY_DN6379_c0_g8~~TRINITY_DN6379_c0_g8_i1.p1  ORF type:complete len:504 (+),score=207.17 TRINITY_DN6379_c0_g8_i1:189-1700(+)